MGNTTQASARERIEAILDDNSFVEIGAGVKARATDLTCRKRHSGRRCYYRIRSN